MPVFQATDTLLAILPVLAGAMKTMTVNKENMFAAIDSSILATDLADYLVRKGIPFREAHEATGKAVRVAAEKRVSLDQLSLDEWQAIGPFESDVENVFDALKSVEKRNAVGGTSHQAVKEQLEGVQRLILPKEGQS